MICRILTLNAGLSKEAALLWHHDDRWEQKERVAMFLHTAFYVGNTCTLLTYPACNPL